MCGSKSQAYRRRTPFARSSSRCLYSAAYCFRASGSSWVEAKITFFPSGRKYAHVVLPTPGRQVLDEDLVERVAGVLLLGLVDDLRPVRREVPLAGPDEVGRQLLDVGQMSRLVPGPRAA